MTEERRVDMVRLVGEERYYDREALLGRDASSVFPSLARQQQEAEAAAGAEALREALGARKFISESELETLRASRGVTADDGAVAVDKPLAEILRERKAAKDAEQAEKWRLMKVGKNRPLDADELQFLDGVAAAAAERERAWSEMERAELEAFKAAVRERSAEPPETGRGPTGKTDPRVATIAGAATAVAAQQPPAAAALDPPATAHKPVLKPLLVKVKPKAAAFSDTKDAKDGPVAAASIAEPPPKKARRAAAEGGNAGSGGGDTGPGPATEASAAAAPVRAYGSGVDNEAGVGNGSDGDSGGGGALAALMGDYGSDSDSGAADR